MCINQWFGYSNLIEVVLMGIIIIIIYETDYKYKIFKRNRSVTNFNNGYLLALLHFLKQYEGMMSLPWNMDNNEYKSSLQILIDLINTDDLLIEKKLRFKFFNNQIVLFIEKENESDKIWQPE